jgi:hypothetical protein
MVLRFVGVLCHLLSHLLAQWGLRLPDMQICWVCPRRSTSCFHCTHFFKKMSHIDVISWMVAAECFTRFSCLCILFQRGWAASPCTVRTALTRYADLLSLPKKVNLLFSKLLMHLIPKRLSGISLHSEDCAYQICRSAEFAHWCYFLNGCCRVLYSL